MSAPGDHPDRDGQRRASEAAPEPAGGAIRRLRDARGLSQLRLALRAGVSARHLSFVESGRSLPGRDVIVRIGRALGLNLRDQNQLLAAAGFAPLHPPRRLADDSMAAVREVFEFLLERHEPNSAVVIDGTWNVVMRNRAHVATMGIFAPNSHSAAGEPANLVEELFDPDSLRPAVANFDLVGNVIRDCLERMVAEQPLLPEARALLDRIESFGSLPPRPPRADSQVSSLLLPIVFRRGDACLSVFSTRTGFVAPLDATVQDLQLETFFPADRESELFLWKLAAGTAG